MTKLNFYIIIFSILLTSCQSIKDGLSGRKAENSDEFLVQKKSPLVMPPNYMELPNPESEEINKEISKIRYKIIALDNDPDVMELMGDACEGHFHCSFKN